MPKTVLPSVLLLLCMLAAVVTFSQEPPNKTDTFFLVKKKGLLGQLGRSISTNTADINPVKKVNPYIIHEGKVIRNIKIVRLGFEREMSDTVKYNNNFGSIVANAFHKKTKVGVIANNLFFVAGDKINPYLLADNERHLREQPFLQDALIVVEKIPGNSDTADILVMVKDVFSIGGSAEIFGVKYMRFELKDENFFGSGSKLSFNWVYDADRKPNFGFGAEYLKRNIRGTFINWAMGYKSYNKALVNLREEETLLYTSFEKPLVSPYMPWVGALDLSYRRTKNNFLADSSYKKDARYSYHVIDGWFGYNFGSQRLLRKNLETRLRKFVALRGLYQHFSMLPLAAEESFLFHYSNINGILASVSVFKQDFFRTNFVYGFGRNEDVQEGFSASLIGGWINKQDNIKNSTRSRPYYGLEGVRSHLYKKGFYGSYTLRIGGYIHQKKWEDLDILLNVDHFTRLKKLNARWYYRQFYSGGITRQLSRSLNETLALASSFGLPYFNNGSIQADLRCTAKTEAVFYNLRKFWGFRFAPFAFTDWSLIKRMGEKLSVDGLYGALGGGLRTRNENLVFGTIELRGYYFPRVMTVLTQQGEMPVMTHWKVELNSNIRFKYSNIFSRKPDFILAN